MAVVDVVHKGFFGTLKDSIKRVMTGLGLLLLAPLMIFWNECRSVQTANSLDEGLGLVVHVDSASVNPELEGKLVHTSGDSDTTETLSDDEFQIKAKGFKLERTVEMYQWDESKSTRTKNDKETTTYTYDKRWSSELHDWQDFRQPEGHLNPDSIPYESRTLSVSRGTLGAFTLDDDEIAKISNFEKLPVTEEQAALSGGAAKSYEGRIYIGANPSSPSVGDIRIGFKVVPVGVLSIVGKQVGQGFSPYQTQSGDALLMVSPSLKGADQMFEDAKQANVVMTWVIRLVGFMMIAGGFGAIFGPLKVIADRVPLIGGVIQGGIGLISFLLAAVVTFFVIAVAWIAARPLLGGFLMFMAVASIAGVVMLILKAKKSKAPEPAAA